MDSNHRPTAYESKQFDVMKTEIAKELPGILAFLESETIGQSKTTKPKKRQGFREMRIACRELSGLTGKNPRPLACHGPD
jgi:hypothetical protein